MKVLVIDIGGTNVKMLATGQQDPRKFPSGAAMTAKAMVAGVKKLAAHWKYEVVSIGYPGVVVKDRILTEPHNLAGGWVGFNFKAAFRCPVKIINDAAMQALGSYRKAPMPMPSSADFVCGKEARRSKPGGRRPSPCAKALWQNRTKVQYPTERTAN
jgi:predicted NBD/HSP70 family sugar kinase